MATNLWEKHKVMLTGIFPFFSNTFHPEIKVICGRDQNGVAAAAKQFGWEELRPTGKVF
ncbi:hypothetical protein QFZ72_003273 [Bacillus sp. V2I10]|nr:hypothetical protein [Bacillus sp. V2I10]